MGKESELSKKLIRAREQAQASPSDVEAATGISRSLLRAYESGRTKPPIEQLEKLAPVYNIEVYQFFTDVVITSNESAWKKRCDILMDEVKLLRQSRDDLYNDLRKK